MIIRWHRFVLYVLFVAVTLLNEAVFSNDVITFRTLLTEMTNRMATIEPGAKFTCRQFSSFDREAISPTENWFANGDTAKFLREEELNGRKEWVLMDAEGPGAVVRWWVTAPAYKTNFYIYIDGSQTPTFAGKINEIVGGSALCDAPLSQETSRGRNLYLPIPYAKSIKITCDNMPEQGNLYYQINYRTYEAGTVVESLTPDTLVAEKDYVAIVNKTLENTSYAPPRYEKILTLPPNETVLIQECNYAGYISQFSLQVEAEDMAQALRSVVLEMDFDGLNTVKCPIGDFFGTGIGINPYHTHWATVEEKVKENGKTENLLTSFWTIPFQKRAEIRLRNYGEGEVVVHTGILTREESTLADIPKENFLYFHANWHQEREISTLGGQGTKDWNYLTVVGRGVYMGDVLSVVNRSSQWWGEGDEKIYVDGETFPSHFGTGTEDYYGYAWCCPERFESPWRAQPRAEGPGNFGNTTNIRYRSLDRIPFEKSFRFDMEVWHWAQTKINYAVTVFWYGTPDAKIVSPWAVEDANAGGTKFEAEVQAPVSYKTQFKVEMGGFNLSKEPAGSIAIQGMQHFKKGKWENDEQLWWSRGNAGDTLELRVQVPDGAKQVTLGLTQACDYGVFEFYLDDIRLNDVPWDACNPVSGSDGVIHQNVTFKIPEGAKMGGEMCLTVFLVGKSRRSIGTMFGIDKITWE